MQNTVAVLNWQPTVVFSNKDLVMERLRGTKEKVNFAVQIFVVGELDKRSLLLQLCIDSSFCSCFNLWSHRSHANFVCLEQKWRWRTPNIQPFSVADSHYFLASSVTSMIVWTEASQAWPLHGRSTRNAIHVELIQEKCGLAFYSNVLMVWTLIFLHFY